MSGSLVGFAGSVGGSKCTNEKKKGRKKSRDQLSGYQRIKQAPRITNSIIVFAGRSSISYSRPGSALYVVTDFFLCNQTASIIDEENATNIKERILEERIRPSVAALGQG